MKIKLMIDETTYTNKPTNPGTINNSIIKYRRELTVKELSEEILKGKTFICSLLERKNNVIKRQESYWKSQQVIALDFDNEVYITNEEGKKVKVKKVTRTIEDILNNSFIKDNAAFIYTTFSHTESHPKFRVVFVLDECVTEIDKCKLIINKLLEMYPDADQSCSDTVRLFYGGKDLHIINLNNKLKHTEGFLGGYIEYTSLRPPKNPKDKYVFKNGSVSSNKELIINKDVESLRNILNTKPTILYNNFQVFDFLKAQSLNDYLGVDSNIIYDIFHDEDAPSGSIFKLEDTVNDIYMYKCHSTSHPFTGTILQITEKLTGLKITDVKSFLMEVYQITIQENETQRLLRNEIDTYKSILQSEEFPKTYPYFYKLFNTHGYLENLYILLDLVKENLPADSDDPRMLFNHSIKKLASHFMKGESITSVRMNFLTFFKLICKLDEDEIPFKLLEKQKEYKKNKGHRYLNNTYEIKTYEYTFFEEIDKRSKEWMDKGLTTKTVSYEGIMRNFGREEADRVFPQDKGKKIPKLNSEIVTIIERQAMGLIVEKGWVTEKEILNNVKLYFRGQQALKESLIKRCLGDIIDKYNLERITCNKKVKAEMNINEDQIPLTSYPKILRYKFD